MNSVRILNSFYPYSHWLIGDDQSLWSIGIPYSLIVFFVVILEYGFYSSEERENKEGKEMKRGKGNITLDHTVPGYSTILYYLEASILTGSMNYAWSLSLKRPRISMWNQIAVNSCAVFVKGKCSMLNLTCRTRNLFVSSTVFSESEKVQSMAKEDLLW